MCRGSLYSVPSGRMFCRPFAQFRHYPAALSMKYIYYFGCTDIVCAFVSQKASEERSYDEYSLKVNYIIIYLRIHKNNEIFYGIFSNRCKIGEFYDLKWVKMEDFAEGSLPMNVAYEDVLNRLKEERRRLNFTQREMGGCVRMTQVSYSKVESGARRLNYYEVKYLCDSKVDVHYVFTGLKCRSVFRVFFQEFNYTELMNLFSILTSVAEMRDNKDADSQWRRMIWHAEIFSAVGGESNADSGVFLNLRRFMGYNQHSMAEKLGVDVKKLRDLENGRNLPDSELLSRLYTCFGICPGVVLKDKNCLASEIGCLLDGYDFEAADSVIQILRSLQELPKALLNEVTPYT